MERLLPVLLLVAALAGCSSMPENKTEAIPSDGNGFPQEFIQGRVVYMQCVGGYEFPAQIQRDEVWLLLPEGAKRLVPKKMATGTLYSNGEYNFWITREEATLGIVDEPTLQCRNNKNKAIWEEARLRGADFRAVGHNPDWYLELSLEGNTVFVGGGGSTRILFKTSVSVVDREKETSTYQMNNGDSKITIVIEGKSCVEPTTGELFDTTVTLYLDGKKLSGCGRALR
ncbi:MAG: hypothetical protein QS748_12140 [Candidatus Endonucleobacter bathymodioli]|uniref:C-type lysozyme inhibitor domain-containing protein n=1 Tax=Candidatus Endonucleibacter bathymodioli TaxID=539814 RepID=A0AA90P0N1_9GAMM|nr:hypothetical protein [Candidatus Endonucleobacter bathymodioli]